MSICKTRLPAWRTFAYALPLSLITTLTACQPSPEAALTNRRLNEVTRTGQLTPTQLLAPSGQPWPADSTVCVLTAYQDRLVVGPHNQPIDSQVLARVNGALQQLDHHGDEGHWVFIVLTPDQALVSTMAVGLDSRVWTKQMTVDAKLKLPDGFGVESCSPLAESQVFRLDEGGRANFVFGSWRNTQAHARRP